MNQNLNFVKLSVNTFFRKYDDIGYLYNQKTKMDVVLDDIASLFISKITREFNSIKNITQSIVTHFISADIKEIEQDFLSLTQDLSKDNFLILSDFSENICSDQIKLEPNYNSVVDHIYSDYMPSSDFLQNYFYRNPKVFSMQIELTSLCNLKCIHCYHGENHPKEGMSTIKIINLLDQLKSLGTLKVVFTGGEAFLHSDLPEILTHARNNDFSISLLTNGTKMSDRLLNSLVLNNVGMVQISLYSLNANVHDAVTQQHGSFKKTMHNINRLLEAKIPLIIASPVMKLNLHSLGDLIKWGVKNKIPVNPDIIIRARSNFDSDNLYQRLDDKDVEEAVKIITELNPSYQNILLSKDINKKALNPNDPICGIGTTSLCISYNGFFYPCPGMQLKVGDFNSNTLSETWSNSQQLIELRKLKKSSYSKCMKCSSIDYCVFCPAKFYNESNGDYLKITKHFCSVAKINRQIAEGYINRKINS